MEQKKTQQADMEQRRTTGFLLGLVLVLAVFYVAMEWNSASGTDDVAAIELDELMHESELVPMTNMETTTCVEVQRQVADAEQLRVVDDDVEQVPDEEITGEGDSDEDLLEQMQQDDDDSKALAALDVDPDNPLNFHVVEELPQFPGGAVELMKWLTKNLNYPPTARQRKVQGRLLAVFYVEKDGAVTGISITKPLSPECDREALRVLRMMPTWQPGIQHDKPCRTKVCIPIVFKL